MTIKELAAELNTLIVAGHGDAKAVVGIPTLFITQDGDIWTNDYRDETEEIKFSAEKLIKRITKPKVSKIQLHDAGYYECSWEDYMDDDIDNDIEDEDVLDFVNMIEAEDAEESED